MIGDQAFQRLGPVRNQFIFGRSGQVRIGSGNEILSWHEVTGRHKGLIEKRFVDDDIQQYSERWPREAYDLAQRLTDE